jgi:hypothetical protein
VIRRFVPKAAVSNRSKTTQLFDHLVGTSGALSAELIFA